MFLGYARGSVGDVVFSRVNGQQTARARNRKPENPKTQSQMIQRSRFAYLSKFYAHAQQAFFKFGFENKKASESDYNAFMSENISVTPYATAQMLADPNTPFVGAFTMTKGSIPTLDYNIYRDYEVFGIYAHGTTTTPTVGDISKYLLDNNNFLIEGDIITFVFIEGDPDEEVVENITEAKAEHALIKHVGRGASWRIIQFALNTSSTVLMTSLGFDTAVVNTFTIPVIRCNESQVRGAVLVASRKTASGLKVSTSRIVLNNETNNVLAVGMKKEWAEFCAQTLKANPDAVLEGRLIP